MQYKLTSMALSVAVAAWVCPMPTFAQDAERSAERTGQAIEKTAEEAGQEAREAGRDLSQAAEPAAQGEAASAGTSAQAQLPQGVTSREVDDAEDLRSLLATATEAAMTKGGFNDLVERFNDEDRNRLGARDVDDAERLDGRIAQLRTAWQQKYGQEFDIDEPEQIFRSVTIRQGEVSDPLKLRRNWPVAALSDREHKTPAQAAIPAGATERPATPLSEDRIEQANLEEGREVAIAQLGGVGDLPPLTVSMTGEVQAWKIDIPNHMDTGRVYQGLLEHLTFLGENLEKWPSDRQQAAQLFTHHVMMALYDVPVEKAQQGGDPQQQQQQQGQQQ